MRLLGQGREADVYALTDGTVLRRYRESGRAAHAEARLMAHLSKHGYPVPRVHDANASDLVLERLEGPTMLDSLRSHPWRAAAYGRVLAGLHDRLHAVRAPGFLPHHRPGTGPGAPAGGERVLHLDLHPGNVILTARGPYVIDWPNARAGDPAYDIAMSECVLRGVVGPPHQSLVIRLFLRGLLHGTRTDPAPAHSEALAARLRDPNLSTAEATRLRRAMLGADRPAKKD